MTTSKTAIIVGVAIAGLAFAAAADEASAQCYYYSAAPVYYAPAPVYYAPAPVVVAPARTYVTYAVRPVYRTYGYYGHGYRSHAYYAGGYCGSGFGFSFHYRH